ncbi:hypothetical protein SAMN05443574_102427 [Haloarcula vallismortis]|uniref:Uncharacterized protein n=2 Tax=Haloarcula vallismortis TaxID=28442 RepID=M0J3N2_HALVA|nr:hypothetical protein [Haloarcula vallismortis]EMA03757.1 hypothetical protein C437_14327 [Haloarcula vallismortis ATCC 29715]SDW32528.1 hypothetical protein SAMN05443574_102427 [Haloarcula vallismortis]
MSELTDAITAAFADETDDEIAQTAAENIAAFAEEYDEDLTSDRVTDLLADAPYDGFQRRFNWVVGELAAENEDCTDSREFRIDGFGELAADPDIGT